jgi:hypothetical protein
MKRTRRERLEHHVAQLRRAFPTPWPVTVVFAPGSRVPKLGEKRPVRGVTYREGRKLFILLNTSYPEWAIHEVLNHEWAHCLDYRAGSAELQRSQAPGSLPDAAQRQWEHDQYHDDHFYLHLGRIERAWESWED